MRAVVADNAPVFEVSARFFDQTCERILVDISHLSGPRIGVRIDNLITGGYQRDARPLMDGNRGDADAGERAKIMRAQPSAPGKDQITFFDIIADLDDVLPGRHASVNLAE